MEKITEYLTRCEVGEGQVRAWEEDIMLPTYGIGKEEENPIFFRKKGISRELRICVSISRS